MHCSLTLLPLLLLPLILCSLATASIRFTNFEYNVPADANVELTRHEDAQEWSFQIGELSAKLKLIDNKVINMAVNHMEGYVFSNEDSRILAKGDMDLDEEYLRVVIVPRGIMLVNHEWDRLYSPKLKENSVFFATALLTRD